MGNLITPYQYAKRIGKSKQYISTLVKQGKLILKDGKIDPQQADKRLEEIKNLARDRSNGGSKKKEKISFWDAQARKEVAKAKLAELEYEMKIGKVIDAEEIYNEQFKKARILRDNILNIPDRILPLLNAEKKISKQMEMFQRELRLILKEFSDDIKR